MPANPMGRSKIRLATGDWNHHLHYGVEKHGALAVENQFEMMFRVKMQGYKP